MIVVLVDKRNEILREVVKNISTSNPLKTEFNIKSFASNKVKRTFKLKKKMLKLAHKFKKINWY